MPLASSKQLAMMSLLHYLMLTLFHSRFLLPVPKLAHRLYNAAASSPSRPREGDSLAITRDSGPVFNLPNREALFTNERWLPPQGFEPDGHGHGPRLDLSDTSFTCVDVL